MFHFYRISDRLKFQLIIKLCNFLHSSASLFGFICVKKIAEFNDKLKFEPVGNPVEMKHSMKAETNTQAKELAKAMADRLKADRK